MEKTMKIYAPKYYPSFRCIADKCKNSCCVGWAIEIDPHTVGKYRKLDRECGTKILDSIVKEKGSPSRFRLSADKRCPHLDERGLCKIISAHGEEYLSNICREHPRFYNVLSGRTEVGLGVACEEAARIILTSDDFDEMILIGKDRKPPADFEYDFSADRQWIYQKLSDKSLPYSERLRIIYEKYGVSPSDISDSETRDVIANLEYINEESRESFLVYSSKTVAAPECEEYLVRALAYFIYRHASAESEADFTSSLGLALFLERLFASLLMKAEKVDTDTAVSIIREISEEIEYSEENTQDIKFMFI